jgi:hypothetical protein
VGENGVHGGEESEMSKSGVRAIPALSRHPLFIFQPKNYSVLIHFDPNTTTQRREGYKEVTKISCNPEPVTRDP